MKILVHAVSAKSGGAETYLRNILGDLAALGSGHRYLLCIPSHLEPDFRDKWPNVTVLSSDIGLKPAWKRFLWDQFRLRRILRRERIDLLLASSDFGLFFPSCRQVLLLRNPLFFSPLYRKEILPAKSFRFRAEFSLRRLLVLFSILFSDFIITASQSMLTDVRRQVPIPDSRVGIYSFGISLERFTLRPNRPQSPAGGDFRMLYVSEYSDYKNLTTLLRALLQLEKRGATGFRLTTTADPRQFPETEISSRAEDLALSSDPRLESHFRVAGKIPYEQISALYQEQDLFIFPSLAESFGHPLVEAMASGLLVLASDIPLCREICGEAALYFSPLDPTELADKILRLKQDPELRRRLSQRGRQRAESGFRWKTHAEDLLRTFDRVMAK